MEHMGKTMFAAAILACAGLLLAQPAMASSEVGLLAQQRSSEVGLLAQQRSKVLQTAGDYFRDPQGRLVFLRGVNVSGDSKVPPFVPLHSREESGQVDFSQLDPLPRWGFNTIRLLFTWEAYEPEPGHFNEEYLQQITRLADEAWARGIYVVLDMHQDAYSKYLSDGCGEGFPAWTVPAHYRRPNNRTLKPCGSLWVVGRMLSPDMHHSYQRFYADRDGARSAFLALWSRLAHHFSTHPGVIGYDLLNEPWGGERSELAPLYRDLARVIRKQDPTSILFIEPQTFMTVFGFKRSHLPKPEFSNFAFAPHFYDPMTMALNSWAHWRAGIAHHGFRLMVEKARELHAPLFVGEFGVVGGTHNGRAFSDYQYDQLDGNFVSGAQWNYTPAWTPEGRDGWNHEDLSIVNGSGELRDSFHPRPFARALSGAPVSQRELRLSDGTLSKYTLEWKQLVPGGDTSVFVPAEILDHPELYELQSSGPGLSCVREDAALGIRCGATAPGDMKFWISRRPI